MDATRDVTGRATSETVGETTVWLSYVDLAERLGIKAASAKRRAIERRWPKRAGNDGKALVAVPREVIEEAASGHTGGATGEIADDDTGEGAGVLVDHLRGELADVRRELRASLAETTDAKERAAKAAAEAELQGRAVVDLRREVEAGKAELEARRTEAAEARERAARAEGELAGMRSRSLWARLLGRG